MDLNMGWSSLGSNYQTHTSRHTLQFDLLQQFVAQVHCTRLRGCCEASCICCSLNCDEVGERLAKPLVDEWRMIWYNTLKLDGTNCMVNLVVVYQSPMTLV